MNFDRLGKDSLVIAALAGTTAKVIQDILGLIIIQFLPPYLNCVRIAAGLLLTPEQVMKGGFWPTLLGFQIDLIVGISVAFVTVLALQKWGHDYYIFKGAIVGLISWALFYNVLSRLLSRVYPTGSILQGEISFFTHLAFGITLTWSAVRLGKLFNRQGQ